MFPRTAFTWAALTCIAVPLAARAAAVVNEAATLPAATIVSRSAHERVWQRTVESLVPNGQTRREIRGYTELATGLCHWDQPSSSWVDASAEIEIVAGTAVARNTQHQVTFPAGLAAGPVELLLPDGQHLKIALTALIYYDPVAQRNAVISQV